MSDLGVLNGPASAPAAVSVGTSPVELKAGASRYGERRVVTFQPTDGDIYFAYSDDGVGLTTSTGLLIRKGQLVSLEASDQIGVWAVAAATTDVRVQEVS